MTHILEHQIVRCPFDRVGDAIRIAFHEFTDHNDDVRIPLHVELGDVKLERDVIAELHSESGYSGYEVFTLQFAPAKGGPYPMFSGKLSASDEGSGFCRVEIFGEYEPPLGLAGALFDAAIGRSLAETSIRDFLDVLKREIEAASMVSYDSGG